jgi:hypothetical protein
MDEIAIARAADVFEAIQARYLAAPEDSWVREGCVRQLYLLVHECRRPRRSRTPATDALLARIDQVLGWRMH